jgi:hypothetical protein
VPKKGGWNLKKEVTIVQKRGLAPRPASNHWSLPGLAVQLLVGDPWSPASWQPAVRGLEPVGNPFFAIFYFILLFFWKCGAWHFGRMDVHQFHFLNLAPTLGNVTSSILNGAWRFH